MGDKLLERAIEHHYCIDDPNFRHEMSVMMGPTAIGGNSVTPLRNGVEIFPAMLQAVEAAEVSITFETHIYWSGEIGRKFAEALAGAAGRGLPVNVLLDWAGCLKMDHSLLELMRDAGIRVYFYRPLRWYHLDKLNNRTHRKLMVVDGRIGFTGGVGIADVWLGDAEDPDHWRDTHYRVEGPVVSQMQAAFNDNWVKTTGQVLNGPNYFPALDDIGDMQAHMFVASPSGGSESMHLMYLLAIAASVKTIDLAASYFVPDKLLIEALIAGERDPAVLADLAKGKLRAKIPDLVRALALARRAGPGVRHQDIGHVGRREPGADLFWPALAILPSIYS